MLHMEVFLQRLEQEHGSSVVSTAPTVPYRLDLGGGRSLGLESAADYPTEGKVQAQRSSSC